jgi:hypothetical protein
MNITADIETKAAPSNFQSPLKRDAEKQHQTLHFFYIVRKRVKLRLRPAREHPKNKLNRRHVM